MVAAYKREAINRMGVRLLATLRRCRSPNPLPKSLRIIAVRLVKEAILKRLNGDTEIHPGIDKIAKWGSCGERQAQRHVRTMENWGLMVPISSGKGGRYHATEYFVDPEVLIRVMVTMGGNPSPDLIAEMRDVSPDIKGDIKPRQKGCHMSPRLRSTQKGPSQMLGSDGGRDA